MFSILGPWPVNINTMGRSFASFRLVKTPSFDSNAAIAWARSAQTTIRRQPNSLRPTCKV